MSEPETPAVEQKSGFFVRVVPALLYVFAIFYSGLTRIQHLPGPDFEFRDKVMHAVAFAFMQLVVLRAVRFEVPAWPPRRQILVTFALVVTAGAALELAQMLTTYRSAEFLDWVADALGAGLVALATDWLARQRARTA
jgi:VanZ family protein